MNRLLATIVSACAITMASLPASQAQAAEATPEAFKPYRMVGAWTFRNHNTAQQFGGAIEVSVVSRDADRTLRGLLSWDGRQTNDRCGTRTSAGDKPVEAELMRTENSYQISFRVNCAKGENPRQFNWVLTCDGKGECSERTAQPWGEGSRFLREVWN